MTKARFAWSMPGVTPFRILATANVAGVAALAAAIASRESLRAEASSPHNVITQSAERMVSRLEAASRAVRLVSTVAVVAADYQWAKLSAHTEGDAWLTELRSAQDEQEAAGLAVEKATTQEQREAGLVRAREARRRVLTASRVLAQRGSSAQSDALHQRNAARLLALARANGGAYLKIAQHAAQLDYLLPPAYIDAFESCLDDAPRSSYAQVRSVLREEGFGEQLVLDRDPIASGSLAQVHRGRFGDREVAVKVQHRGLRETSVGDVDVCVAATRLVERLFPEFKLGWLADEIAPHLAIELDFRIEAENCRRSATHFASWRSVAVPTVLAESSRVLVMSFETGHNATSRTARNYDLPKRKQLAALIARAFAAQTFRFGFAHCDPHGANVLVRPDGSIVLLDHGLYKRLDDEFRLNYARLWRAILLADVRGIEDAASSLGVGDLYPLFAAVLTRKPWDDIANPDFASLTVDTSDHVLVRTYAQKYAKQITILLNRAPRQLLLLLKMSDCLRRLDSALDARVDCNLITLHATLDALYAHDRNLAAYVNVKIRLWLLELSAAFPSLNRAAFRTDNGPSVHVPDRVSTFAAAPVT